MGDEQARRGVAKRGKTIPSLAVLIDEPAFDLQRVPYTLDDVGVRFDVAGAVRERQVELAGRAGKLPAR
jgi:hypothetical protein